MDQTSAAGEKSLSARRGKKRVLPDGRVPQGKRKRAVGLSRPMWPTTP